MSEGCLEFRHGIYYGSSGSALDEIFTDKDLSVAHFGISCSEVSFDSDESDLDVQLSDDD